jgi:hypothetical protein
VKRREFIIQPGPTARACCRAGRPRGGRDRDIRNAGATCSQAGHRDDPHRYGSSRGPGGKRARCQLGTARRQRHRDEPHGTRPRRKAAGTGQRACPRNFSRGRPLECGQPLFRARLQGDGGRGPDLGDRGSIAGGTGACRFRCRARCCDGAANASACCGASASSAQTRTFVSTTLGSTGIVVDVAPMEGDRAS